MQYVAILKGIPASGKSTAARDLVVYSGFKRLNNDTLRDSIDCSVWTKENEQLIKWARQELLKKFLQEGENVVVDNVNASKQHTDEVMKIVEDLNIDCEVYEVPIYCGIETAIDRDTRRSEKERVGLDVIRKFWKKLGGESFKDYVPRKMVFHKVDYKVIQDPTKPACYVVDLDRTVADNNWRNPYDASDCEKDPVIIPVERVVKNLWSKYKIIFVSARTDEYYQQSRNWVSEALGMNSCPLLMRKTGDTRPDQIVKREIFLEHILPNYYTLGVFDDRPRVCRMWRSLGLQVFQVNDIEF